MADKSPTHSQEDGDSAAEISEVGSEVFCKLCLCEQPTTATWELQSCNCVFCVAVREYNRYITTNYHKNNHETHLDVIWSRKALKKTPARTQLHHLMMKISLGELTVNLPVNNLGKSPVFKSLGAGSSLQHSFLF